MRLSGPCGSRVEVTRYRRRYHSIERPRGFAGPRRVCIGRERVVSQRAVALQARPSTSHLGQAKKRAPLLSHFDFALSHATTVGMGPAKQLKGDKGDFACIAQYEIDEPL